MKEIASLSILPGPVGLRAMRLFIKTFADGAGLDYETANDLCVACGEAVNNAIEHGEAAEEPLTIQWYENGEALEVHILDLTATPMPSAPATPDLESIQERERGLGLYLMQALVDEVRVSPREKGGHVTTLVKKKGGLS